MSEPNPNRRTYDPPRLVQVQHHADRRWYRGAQFEWVRWPTGEWRAGVTYTTAPGARHIRSVTADQLIAEIDPDIGPLSTAASWDGPT